MTSFSGNYNYGPANRLDLGDGDESQFNVQAEGLIWLDVTISSSGLLNGTATASLYGTGTAVGDTDGDNDDYSDSGRATITLSNNSGHMFWSLGPGLSLTFDYHLNSIQTALVGTVTVTDSHLSNQLSSIPATISIDSANSDTGALQTLPVAIPVYDTTSPTSNMTNAVKQAVNSTVAKTTYTTTSTTLSGIDDPNATTAGVASEISILDQKEQQEVNSNSSTPKSSISLVSAWLGSGFAGTITSTKGIGLVLLGTLGFGFGLPLLTTVAAATFIGRVIFHSDVTTASPPQAQGFSGESFADTNSMASLAAASAPFQAGDTVPTTYWSFNVDTQQLTVTQPITPQIQAVLDQTASRLGFTISNPVGFTFQGASNDVVLGGSGNDTIIAGTNEQIDGRGGTNTVVFGGLRSQYQLTAQLDGSLQITDLRSGSPNGTDFVSNVQILKFGGGTTILAHPSYDFNGDFSSDMLLRRGDGLFEVYDIFANRITSAAALGQVGTEFQLFGIGDFNGDGTSDMLLRRSDGLFEIYDISSNQITSASALGQVGNEWQKAGIGDFNGDGSNDMLLRRGDGLFEVYDIKNNQITTAATLGQVGPEFQVAGIGDFNGDGTSDMVLRRSDGLYEGYLIGGNSIASASLWGQVGPEFKVAGFGDFNGDGTTDMLLRRADGLFEVYDINSNKITSGTVLGQVGPEFQVSEIGDFNGDGTSDMLLRRASDGLFEVYNIKNNQITSAAALGQVGTEWTTSSNGTAATGSTTESDAQVANLVQAMASLPSGGTIDNSSTAFLRSDTSQQPFLTAPQHG